MGDATGVLLDGRLVIAGSALIVLAIALAPPLAKRADIGHAHAFALVVSLGVVLAMTLGNRSGDRLDVARLARWEPERWIDPDSAEWVLNVVLFGPVTAFWGTAMRRPAAVLAGGMLLAVTIEYAQGVFRLGTGDQADLVANGLGVAIGAVLTWWWMRRPAGFHETWSPRWTPRMGVAAAVAMATAAGVAVTGIGIAADQLAEDVSVALEGSLGSAGSGDLRPLLALDDEHALAYFTTPQNVDADAIVHVDGDDRVAVRYPIDFLGARRCVVADIARGGTQLRTMTAAACDEGWAPLASGPPAPHDDCCSASASQRSSRARSSAWAVASSAPTRASSR